MNKVFKSVWSEALGAWVAASELCRGRGKGGGKVARSAVAAALVLAAGSAMASTATGNGATTVGLNDNALGDGSYANGAAGADSTAIGHNVKTNGGNAFSIGSIITNGAASSIVMGNGGTNAVTMDAASSNTVFFAPNGGSVTNSANSFAFNPYGTAGTTGSSDSVNISGTVTNAANAVALGSKSSVSAANSVALGAGSVADQANTVSVGSATSQRKITNVKAGDVSISSTEAVNGSQLAATNATVADAVKYDTTTHDSVTLGNTGTPVIHGRRQASERRRFRDRQSGRPGDAELGGHRGNEG
ncbi:ESPR-type extended signal peptide-containing protein [Caballeronia sordidicola]|uniref:ESPR-type extended signal peptide-containing protein n=1 Tax=Caballeronia sordidicola TaxID=196367 RepID=UPI00094E9E62|nr:ESPR-type extended signal peptide-containing protein [Caballeronia sordidicola]